MLDGRCSTVSRGLYLALVGFKYRSIDDAGEYLDHGSGYLIEETCKSLPTGISTPIRTVGGSPKGYIRASRC